MFNAADVVKRYGPDLLRDQNRLPLRILLENARYSRFDLLKDPDCFTTAAEFNTYTKSKWLEKLKEDFALSFLFNIYYIKQK